jgi:hypothetical protein
MSIENTQNAADGTGAWFRADGAVTGVGSVPHEDVAHAVEFVARVAPEVPFWPQLRRMSPREAMLPQTFGVALRQLVPVRNGCEFALPGDRVERFAAALERDAARLDPANAAGFFALIDAFDAGMFPRARAVKGQAMGPVTLACSLVVDGKPLLERRDLLAMIGDHVVRQARWQAETLQRLSPSVVVVLDEADLGTAIRSRPGETGDITDLLRSVVLRIRRPGVLVGLHCCDEVPMCVLDAVAPDLYSFDAHHGARAMATDPFVHRFVASGGRLAWGWIPTQDDLSRVDANKIVERWYEATHQLSRHGDGVDEARVFSSSLVTASCGLAGSSLETCERSFALAADVARGFALRCVSA